MKSIRRLQPRAADSKNGKRHLTSCRMAASNSAGSRQVQRHRGSGRRIQTELELAVLAIALKRRVIVIQAVDHAQLDKANQFESFVSALQDDSRDVDELELGIASVLQRLSSLELSRRGGIRDLVLTPGEVDDLLQSAYRLRALGERLEAGGPQPDVAIDIVRSGDGSVVVLPARPAARFVHSVGGIRTLVQPRTTQRAAAKLGFCGWRVSDR